MLALIQRVNQGKVIIEQTSVASIQKGYVILLGIFDDDTEKDIEKLIPKLLNLRINADSKDKMNLSLLDIKGELLVVSQFTLCADVKDGRRPSFIKAKPPEEANRLYELFVSTLKESKLQVKTGVFGAKMEVIIHNDGPVTIILDSKKL